MTKPKSVHAAVSLMLVGILGSSISVSLNILNAPQHLSRPVMLGFAATFLGMYALLVYMLSSGRNWARLAYAALTITGGLMGMGGPDPQGVHHPFVIVNHWVGMFLGVVTMVLLFLPVSNAWYAYSRKAG